MELSNLGKAFIQSNFTNGKTAADQSKYILALKVRDCSYREVFPSVSSTAFLPVLRPNTSHERVDHQVLELQSFYQIRIPDHSSIPQLLRITSKQNQIIPQAFNVKFIKYRNRFFHSLHCISSKHKMRDILKGHLCLL